MRKSAATLALMFTMLFAGTGAAHAEAPSETLTASVTDNAGVLNADRLDLLVSQVEAETNYELYVYFTDTFDGMPGAQWAVETAEKSGLDASNAVLFAVAVDGKYGSAFPSGSSVASEISQIEKSAISALKADDWDGAVEAYGNTLIDVAQGKASASEDKANGAVSGFFTFLKWTVGIIVSLVLLVLGSIFGFRFFVAARAKRADFKFSVKEMNSVKNALPAQITQLDDLFGSAKEKVEFATSLYGEKNTVGYNDIMLQASKSLQKAAAVSANHPEKISTKAEADARFHELAMAESTLNGSVRRINGVIREINAMEAKVSSVKKNQRETAELLSTSAKEIEAAEKALAELGSAYAPAFLVNVSRAVEGWKEARLELAAKAAKVDALVAEDDYTGARKNSIDVENELRVLKKFRSNFNSKVKTVRNYDAVIAEQVNVIQKEIYDGSPENKLSKMAPLIQAVKEAMAKTKGIDVTAGNPSAELQKVMMPVKEYRETVSYLRTRRDKVEAVKKSIRQNHRAADEGLDTIMNGADDFGFEAEYADDFAVAQKMLKTDFATVLADADNLDAYDVDGVNKLKEKQAVMFSNYTKVLSGASARVERSKAEKARKEAERRAEEKRKKRKREEEEEERRRAARRRSSSYGYSYGSRSSSSSSYGYGGGYSSSSYDSGSSFSSSGGSFDSGGSGGSF